LRFAAMGAGCGLGAAGTEGDGVWAKDEIHETPEVGPVRNKKENEAGIKYATRIVDIGCLPTGHGSTRGRTHSSTGAGPKPGVMVVAAFGLVMVAFGDGMLLAGCWLAGSPKQVGELDNRQRCFARCCSAAAARNPADLQLVRIFPFEEVNRAALDLRWPGSEPDAVAWVVTV
jgi:hypothetical protein